MNPENATGNSPTTLSVEEIREKIIPRLYGLYRRSQWITVHALSQKFGKFADQALTIGSNGSAEKTDVTLGKRDMVLTRVETDKFRLSTRDPNGQIIDIEGEEKDAILNLVFEVVGSAEPASADHSTVLYLGETALPSHN